MECHLENMTVHYASIGEGRPILMLHGARLDYRHILNDLEPAFIDHVIPDQRFTQVGESWGGILSRAVLARHPYV